MRALFYVDVTVSGVHEAVGMADLEKMYRRWYDLARFGGRPLLLRPFRRHEQWDGLSGRDLDVALADHLTASTLRASLAEIAQLDAARHLMRRLEAIPSPVPARYLVGVRRTEPLRTFMPEETARFAARSTGVDVVLIDTAGHSIPQEDPARTSAEIEQFAELLR